ncbi:MAG TPA: tetratricopeptide repeat protein [Kofleriaceae bacterium]|nr:tetratricopeptide repeat protein [Kofleriaceae bacterium]
MGPFGRIAALACTGAAAAWLLAAGAGDLAAAGPPPGKGSLAPAVPGVPAKMPDPFAVMAFENRSGVPAMSWMSAGMAFLVGEKAESNREIRPVYGSLVVPAGPAVAVTRQSVAAFAREAGARWVWTGWVARPSWELQLGVSLWRVDGSSGDAVKVGEVVRKGQFAAYSDLAAAAIEALCDKAGLAVDEEERAELERKPSADFYAYTLFGRGLSAVLGSEGQAEDLERAFKNLQRAVVIDPKLVEAQRVLAEVYAAQGKPDRAKGRLAYALSMRPDYYPALAAGARLARDAGRLDQARDLYQRALGVRPWDLEARYLMGKTMWDSGDADGAFRELSRVVDRRPRDVRARRILVLIHASRGDNDQLVGELEQVAALDPSDESTRMDLAAAYAATGRLDKAIAAYKAIVDGNPRQAQAMKFLGDLHKRQGHVDRAVKYYGDAVKADPDDPRAYFLLGAIYVEAGNDKQAKRIYQQAQRFKKYLAETYNNLGAIAYRERDLDTAMWYHRRAVLRRPSSARFRYNYALSLSASKYTEEALAQVDAALKIEPNHVELHYLRGVVLLRRGQADEARAEFEKTLALNAKHEGAKHNIALIDELKRRSQEGEVVIEGKQGDDGHAE